jgi:Ni,Fe-hydrogenase maturation factor
VSGESALPSKSIGALVLGLGNVLLGDDGVGAAAVAAIERDRPAG